MRWKTQKQFLDDLPDLEHLRKEDQAKLSEMLKEIRETEMTDEERKIFYSDTDKLTREDLHKAFLLRTVYAYF